MVPKRSGRLHLGLGTVLLAIFLTTAATAAEAPPGATWLAEIRGQQLDPSRAVKVGRLSLKLGGATLRIEEGTFYPATPVAGRVVELFFDGAATLELEPPDAIEKSQLELFTRAGRLAESIGQAVLVIAADGPPAAILGKARATPAAADIARVQQLYVAWLAGPERKILGIEQALLQDAAGDLAFQGFFAGLFQGEALGRFVYLVDPSEREQSSLGQFVAVPLDRKEKRKIDRELQRQQKRGRLIGLETDDLGSFDSWVSASQVDAAGAPRPGHPGFEPRHYELDASFSGKELALRGKARLRLATVVGGCRGIRLRLHSDLKVLEVRRAGAPLFFHQQKGEVLALLAEAPEPGSELDLEIDYAGDLLDKVSRGYFELRDSLAWYPHVGEVDRATYEVTFHWPRRLQLLAGGQVVGSGPEGDDSQWEKRRSELPTMGIGFEMGRFEISERQVGHVAVKLGLPPIELGDSRKESSARILGAVADSLTYFEEIFGPYPLDRIEVALTPRLYSQSLLGFMSLSSLMMADHDLLTVIFGLEDPRTVVAHEVAHQWWGHAVGWESYRDLWLSESLANYSSVLFARNRLKGDLRFAIGPTRGWENDLLEAVDEGRTVESLGPLTLGTRLDSSKSDDAYRRIVYKKGAIVLGTLANYFGEESLLKMLKTIVHVAAHRPMSTATFLTLIEKQSDASLEAFGKQFVFGTGLPEIYYDYRFTRTDSGKWRIEGSARQVSSLRFRWAVTALPQGGFGVTREVTELLDVTRSRLVLPVEVDLFDPAKVTEAKNEGKKKDKDKDKAVDPREVGNTRFRGRLLIEGELGKIDFEVDNEPKNLWINREKQVFARAFSEVMAPKRTLLFKGSLESGAGRREEAKALLQAALAAQGYAGPRYADVASEADQKKDDDLLDGVIHRQLARIALESGAAGDAKVHLERAAELLKSRHGRLFEHERMVLEARLALLTGQPAKAFDLLEKKIVGKNASPEDPEAMLVFALAARATGHGPAAKKALELARKAGADVSALDQAEPSR